MIARMRVAGFCSAIAVALLAAGCQNPNDPASKQIQTPAQTEKDQAPGEAELGELDSTNPNVKAGTHVAAARLHESQGNLLAAIHQYQLCLKEKPDDTAVLNRIGLLFDRIGNGAQAERAYVRAIEIAPENAHLHNNLAFSYILRGRWPEAQAELSRAIELAPDFARARVNMAMVLAQQDMFEEAQRQFTMVLPEGDVWYNMGLMYQAKRRTPDAAYAFKRALQAEPRLSAAQDRLAKLPGESLSAADERITIENRTRLAWATDQPPAPAIVREPVSAPEPEAVAEPVSEAPQAAATQPADADDAQANARPIEPVPASHSESLEYVFDYAPALVPVIPQIDSPALTSSWAENAEFYEPMETAGSP